MARLCLILAVLTSFVVSVAPAGAQPRPQATRTGAIMRPIAGWPVRPPMRPGAKWRWAMLGPALGRWPAR